MCTHKICFLGEVRKILRGYPILSGATQSLTMLLMGIFMLYRSQKVEVFI